MNQNNDERFSLAFCSTLLRSASVGLVVLDHAFRSLRASKLEAARLLPYKAGAAPSIPFVSPQRTDDHQAQR